MAVSSVDRENICLGLGHFDGALEEVAGGANRGADAQPAMVVFCGARIFELFLDVFYGDQALEVEIRSTTRSFSMRCFCRMRSASSRVVPTGTVTRLSFVITELTSWL